MSKKKPIEKNSGRGLHLKSSKFWEDLKVGGDLLEGSGREVRLFGDGSVSGLARTSRPLR